MRMGKGIVQVDGAGGELLRKNTTGQSVKGILVTAYTAQQQDADSDGQEAKGGQQSLPEG